MLTPVICRGCGQRLEIPEGHSRSKLRCAECGVFNELPKDLVENLKANPAPAKKSVEDDAADLLSDEPPVRAKQKRETPSTASAPVAKAKPVPPAAPPAPPAETPSFDEDSHESATYGFAPSETKEPEREVLIQGTNEDDGKAYQVTGDIKKKRCPECEKRTDYRAKICKECGYNFETKEKVVREFTPIIREWEAGWPLQRRMIVFAAAQVVNLVILIMSAISGMLCVGTVLLLVMAALQAFLLGTFDTLKVVRNNKGKVTITRNWRFFFKPKPPDKIKWQDHEGVVLIQGRELDLVNWVMCIILLMYGILPGVLFWWYVIKPDQFHVALSMAHGYPETTLYRGTNEAQAREILQVVMDATGLKDNR